MIKRTTNEPVTLQHDAIAMTDLRAQFATIERDIHSAIEDVLTTQRFTLGPQCEALEQELARYCQRRFGVGVGSGTDALMLGLRACGVKSGDDVIVPTFTFVATAGAVSAVGARPVFADIDPETLHIDPRSVESLVTPRTAAIIAVHLYGGAAELERLQKIAARHKIPLIEDNAQSLGGSYGGRKLGSFGVLSGTSFYPSKNLGAYGDAGMVLTDSEELAERVRVLRNHGQKTPYVSVEPGWNSRLDELQAAVLRVKLRRLDDWIAARRVHAAHYTDRFARLSSIRTPCDPVHGRHTYYLYTVRIRAQAHQANSRAASARDHVAQHLAERGIASTVFYPMPLHLQPIYASSDRTLKPGMLPVAEQACTEVLSLPIYAEMTAAHVDRVAGAVSEALETL